MFTKMANKLDDLDNWLAINVQIYKMIIKFVSTFKHIIHLSACQSKNFKITKIGPCIATRSLQNILVY